MSRFDVSEKFAGKEGPCPKCKATIVIPTLDEQVVVHAPEHSGPKDSTGKSVLQPIARTDTKLSGVQITLIIAGIILFLAGTFVVGLMFEDKQAFPLYLLAIGAALFAFPVAYVAYTFLRNQESEGFKGQDLWSRLGICAGVYTVLWILMPVMSYAFPGTNNSIGTIVGIVGMIAAGGMIAMYSLDLDYIIGIVHYGMYLGICLFARIIAGLAILPGDLKSGEEVPSTVISMLGHMWF
jgi:uncharacterized membrane protein